MDDEWKAFMQAQRAEYARALPAKVDALEALWAEARQAPDRLKEFVRAAHSIYGAAGTFGLSEVTQHAGTIETVALEALETGSGLAAAQVEQIGAALQALRRSLPAPP